MNILQNKPSEHLSNLINKYTYFYYILYFFTFALTSLFLIVLDIYWLSYLLIFYIGLGWSIFFWGKTLNIAEHLLLAFALFYALFTAFVITFAFLTIPIVLPLYISFFVLSFSMFIWKKTFHKENINFKFSQYDLLAIVITGLALFAKVFSVRDILIPDLHDPITHAYFTKQIVETGNIDFFYSPGLHIFSSLNYWIGEESFGRQILLVTNIFSALVGSTAYVYTKHAFKSSLLALIFMTMFSFGYDLSALYTSAGKNAVVSSYSVLFLFFFSLWSIQKKSTWKGIILSAVTLSALFIIHYPLGLLALVYFGIWYIVNYKKSTFLQNSLISIGALIGILWMVKTYPLRYLNPPLQSTPVELYTIPKYIIENSFVHLKGFFASRVRTFGPLTEYVKFLYLPGFLFLAYHSLRKRKLNEYLFILWFLACISISLLITVLNISSLSIVTETFILSMMIFLYFFASYFFFSIYSALERLFSKEFMKFGFIVGICIITGMLSTLTYQLYRKHSIDHVLKNTDIEAFEWVDNHLGNDEKILINSNRGGDIIFSSDAGGWLEIYSGNAISAPFYDYGSILAHKNFDNYEILKSDLKSCEALNYFEDTNYDFYFQGSRPVFGPQLASQELLLENDWEIVYQRDNSTVYKIPDCNEVSD